MLLKTVSLATAIAVVSALPVSNYSPSATAVSTSPMVNATSIETDDYVMGMLRIEQFADSEVEAERFYGIGYRLLWDDDNYHYHNEKIDDHCNTFSSVFYPYTGFRLFHEMKFGRKLGFYHSTHLVYCFRGRVTAHTSVANRDSVGLNFEDTMCINEREPFAPDARGCYRIARRKETPNVVPWLRSEGFIGGLFRCPTDREDGPCSNEDAVPVAPLVGDEPYMALGDIHSPMSYAVRMPVVYTPDYFGYMYPRNSDKWAQYIDIDSKYNREEDIGDEFMKVQALNECDSTIEISAYKETDINYKIKQAYTLIKNSVPASDPFHKELVNTNEMKEFLFTYGLKALMFMRKKSKAQHVYDTIANLFNPPAEGPETFSLEQWRQMVEDY